MPTYEHFCGSCNKTFDDFYSIKENPPTNCKLCQTPGQVKRLVSGGSGMGIVKLSGREMIDKAKKEGEKMRINATKDENLNANLIGEDKYHSGVKATEEFKENFKQL